MPILFWLSLSMLHAVETTQLPAAVSVEIEYRVDLPRPGEQVKRARVWIPVPRDDAHQAVLSIDSPADGKLTKDGATGNRFLYFEYSPAQQLPAQIVCRYQVRRLAERPIAEPKVEDADEAELKPYLAPVRLLPVDGPAKEVSDRIVQGAESDLEKAQLIYKYVFEHMRYDKSEPGWGQADFTRACEVGKGNCTDFHGMFIALCRAQGIPARFEVGVELANDGSVDVPGSYHCWAWFHTASRGWIPVDISTAWKRSEAAKAEGDAELARREMHAGFGWLDAYRVAFSRGLDVGVPSTRNTMQRFIIDPVVLMDDQLTPAAPIEQGGFQRSWSYQWMETK